MDQNGKNYAGNFFSLKNLFNIIANTYALFYRYQFLRLCLQLELLCLNDWENSVKKILGKVVRYPIRKMVTVILLITMRNVTGTEVIVAVRPDITVSLVFLKIVFLVICSTLDTFFNFIFKANG